MIIVSFISGRNLKLSRSCIMFNIKYMDVAISSITMAFFPFFCKGNSYFSPCKKIPTINNIVLTAK